MARGKSFDDFKSEHAPDPEVLHLRAEVDRLSKQLAAEKKQTGQARINALEVTESIEAAQPRPKVYKPQKTDKSAISCVMHLTDLHMGEVTEPDEVEGINAFSPDIFESRIQSFGSKVLDHVAVQRSGYHITDLHILATGDYVSGDIHYELQTTNAFPAPRQAVECGYRIGELVEMLAPHFDHVHVHFLTTDNHGRLTRRNQYSGGGENNYGYIVGSLAKQYTSKLENVSFDLHPTQTMLVTIGCETYLCFHGHQITGWAGLPYYGFDRRLMKEAVKRMNLLELTFTTMVAGHFHTAVDTIYWILGGSLSGTNTFDHGQGRHAQAHQTSWFVHPDHGRFGFQRWWL